MEERQVKVIINKYRYLGGINDEKELTLLYREMGIEYSKFFKMDGLCKIGFLASEMLLADEPERFQPLKDRAVICFNGSSSLQDDSNYNATINDADNYYPSPSLFVYTLSNIVTGELAIRNKYYGESSFYISRIFDAEMICRTVNEAFMDEETNSILVGWTEYFREEKEALMMLVSRADDNAKGELMTVERLQQIYTNERQYKKEDDGRRIN